ncbi:hypothetical protein UFOVP48_69 [uncultured Caudovirales phage]|uniref:Uncharacterized protein n=1 Tax=uncultured Caudovirales phage TaxID=2100421 RepID=A0A6J5KU52_9CAUD|nr:hypothetical protein UFOVP48_69 [uncultured Caudovirales phage]
MSTEKIAASGVYTVECYGADGKLKWAEETPNRVVSVGLQNMAGAGLSAGTQSTTWYLGLITGPGAGVTVAFADTMASHAGWTESTAYSNANRVTAIFAAATSANPSVVTNSASAAAFNINTTATIAGAFLVNSNTKSGTTGVLFSASNFTGGDRNVVSGDTLNVTYTFSLTGV